MEWKIKRKFLNIVSLVVILFSQVASVTTINAQAGDDPGVTISAPSEISSRDQVELKVSVATSAGKLDEDGTVAIKIPKSIVANPSELTSQLVIGDPFYLDNPAYIDDGQGNYILNVKYDHTKIDQLNAQGYNFSVKFTAPLMHEGEEEFPDNVDFGVTLDKAGVVQSMDSAHSNINKYSAMLPLFRKDSTRPVKNVDGTNAHILSKQTPAKNIFRIVVNYSQQSVNNAKVVDKLPTGTILADPNHDYPATGDDTIYNHLRILKVTSTDAGGNPNGWEYVTDQFKDKIVASDTDFNVDFGDIKSTDAYVIDYAVSVIGDPTETDFGLQTNHAELQNDGNIIRTSDVAVALDDSQYTATSLSKTVSQSELATNSAQLEYKLKLTNNSDIIKAGTVVSDPLPAGAKFIKTTENNDYSDATYDKATNTVSYVLQHDLNVGSSASIGFKVDFSSSSLKVGDKIINKANYTYAGSTIYSNVATTIVAGSATLKKVDSSTQGALAGAQFKIVDKKTGKVAQQGLVTDANGMIGSDVLSPGQYSFIETKAPAGYVLDKTPIDFTVVKGQVSPVEVTMENHQATKVEGDKTWDDNDNKDGSRPDSITVNLLADGKIVQSKKVTQKDNWHYEFNNLPKDKNGKDVKYTVTENSIPEYTTEINGFNITNHYTPEKNNLTVVKKWNDDNNKDGIRSTQVKAQLYENGSPKGDIVILSEDNNWTYSWKNLSKKAKSYTVKEVDVPNGYKSSVDNNGSGNIVITNTHKTDIPNKPGTPNNPNQPNTSTGTINSHSQSNVRLPQTDEKLITSSIMTIVGILILSGFSYYYFFSKKIS